ncbi:MAG: prepilin-type N-terminal cleavage/methylation domain-containing protein [Nitrospirota bacterium]
MTAKGKGQRAKSKKNKGSGFTLLEVMIALAIIGISLTVVLHTVNYHANVVFENTMTTMMYQAAKEKMYDLEETQTQSSGTIEPTKLTFQNVVLKSKLPGIVQLITVVSGYNKEVTLSEFVVKKEKLD